MNRTVKDKEQESRQELWVDARISLEKSVILMELIGLVCFVMRGDLELVGMKRVAKMIL